MVCKELNYFNMDLVALADTNTQMKLMSKEVSQFTLFAEREKVLKNRAPTVLSLS